MATTIELTEWMVANGWRSTREFNPLSHPHARPSRRGGMRTRWTKSVNGHWLVVCVADGRRRATAHVDGVYVGTASAVDVAAVLAEGEVA